MQKDVLVLTRKGDAVFCNNAKLTIVAQASKGPGKEVVKIDGLPNSHGQKWISLAKLQEGENVLSCKAKEVTTGGQRGFVLTEAESTKVASLKAQIDAIIDAAKARYVEKPSLDADPSKMTEAERLAKIEAIKQYYNLA